MILFASDLDNTIVFRKEREMYTKPEDIEAIKQFQEVGNLFGVCTGRAPNGFVNHRYGIPVNFRIMSTGAVIYDRDDQIIQQGVITSDVVERFKEMIPSPTAVFAHADGEYRTLINTKSEKMPWTIPDLEDPEKCVITGMSVLNDSEEEAEECRQWIEHYFGDDLVGYCNRTWVDIVKIGHSKGNAAQTAKAFFKADLLAGIGDGRNDIALLQASDIAFTFHDAPDEVKAEADYLVHSVAEAIEILLKL